MRPATGAIFFLHANDVFRGFFAPEWNIFTPEKLEKIIYAPAL